MHKQHQALFQGKFLNAANPKLAADQFIEACTHKRWCTAVDIIDAFPSSIATTPDTKQTWCLS